MQVSLERIEKDKDLFGKRKRGGSGGIRGTRLTRTVGPVMFRHYSISGDYQEEN
jgi:hypothetical protein